MVRTIAQIQAQLSGEVNAEGNRSDSNTSVSPFTLLRDLIDSLDTIITQVGLRVGSEAVVTGGTAIVFQVDGIPSPLPSTDYSINIRCFDGSGNNIDYALTNKAVGGFTLTPSLNGTAEYTAVINT